ncbi:hypothetical protein D0Y65_048194 [Glycine soja]|uniref:RNase H type-1 domain-containing protein n=1 Tax=Glycine soja TaxID=3848 RepID=A0A445FRX9_GLYSO|nr:hypothetical protein D0Y65_048194 [Glycine soja]
MVVSDLMLNGEGRWNETLIEEILDLEDTMVMFSMPLANLQEEDVRIWRHNRNDKTTSDSDLEEWKPPGPGFVKCNIDVAYFQEQQWWGKGMCIQDDKGWFVRATMNIRHGMPEVHEGEALVLLQTLTWLKNMDYQYVEVEFDCKRLTDSLDRNIMDDSEFGMILNKCKRILMSCPNHKLHTILLSSFFPRSNSDVTIAATSGDSLALLPSLQHSESHSPAPLLLRWSSNIRASLFSLLSVGDSSPAKCARLLTCAYWFLYFA